MVRLAGGIILGYVFFALTAVLVFAIPGRDPHAPAEPAFMVGTIGAGIIGALAGGYIGAAIARGHERVAGLVIAAIICGAAILSLTAEGAQWSQWSALLLMSPAAWAGAFIRYRRVRVR